jgi:ABC-2 type transport system ATP-binding protein
MTPAISVAGLSRSYRGTLAIDNVSSNIEPGSITGLLGRNGAGKTTLMRILAGHEFPSAGSHRGRCRLRCAGGAHVGDPEAPRPRRS